MVPGAGLEPARPFRKARDFKSLVSTYFTIRAILGRTSEVRTRDQRIKSPLLYRLSYSPKIFQLEVA